MPEWRAAGDCKCLGWVSVSETWNHQSPHRGSCLGEKKKNVSCFSVMGKLVLIGDGGCAAHYKHVPRKCWHGSWRGVGS